MRFATQFMVHRSRYWVKPKIHTFLMAISAVGYENVKIDSTTEKKYLHSKPYYHRLVTKTLRTVRLVRPSRT